MEKNLSLTQGGIGVYRTTGEKKEGEKRQRRD